MVFGATPYNLTESDRADLMARLAMAWDGQWFLKVYDEYGWDAAALINARVRQAFGRIEMLLLMRALGKQRANDLEDAVHLLQVYYNQVFTAGFSGRFEVTGDSVHITVTECAAMTGAQKAGLERRDQACIGCSGLFQVYFETLLRGQTVDVKTLEQMGCSAERCHSVVQVREPS
jgi:hypothetical protein